MQNKCLGVFLVAVAFPLVILSILLFSTRGVLGASFYKELFSQTNAYVKLAQITAQPKTGETPEDIFTLIAQNAEAGWYQKNIEKNLDEFFTFINGKKDLPDLGIDLKSLNLKKELAKNQDLPSEVINDLPDRLTIESYLDYMQKMRAYIAKNAATGTPQVAKQDLKMIDQQIQQASSVQEKYEQNLAAVKKSFFYLKLGTYIIYALTLLMLILIAVAARHYPPAIFRWVGEALVIPSAMLSLIIFLGQRALIDYNPLSHLKMTADWQQLFSPLYLTLTNDILNDMQITAIVVGMVGLILVIISYILPKFIAQDIKASG